MYLSQDILNILAQRDKHLLQGTLTDDELAQITYLLKTTPNDHNADNTPNFLRNADIANLLRYSPSSISFYLMYADRALRSKWSLNKIVDGQSVDLPIAIGVSLFYQFMGLPQKCKDEILNRIKNGELDIPLSNKILREYAQRKKLLKQTIKQNTKSHERIVGNALRELRKRRNLTQKEIAKMIGVSRASISLLESPYLGRCGNPEKRSEQLFKIFGQEWLDIIKK